MFNFMIVDVSYISNPISFPIMIIVALSFVASACAALAFHVDYYVDKKKKILSYICAVIATLSLITFGVFNGINRNYVYPNRRDVLKSNIEERYKSKAVFEGDMVYLFDETGNSRGTLIWGETETPGKYVVCKIE